MIIRTFLYYCDFLINYFFSKFLIDDVNGASSLKALNKSLYRLNHILQSFNVRSFGYLYPTISRYWRMALICKFEGALQFWGQNFHYPSSQIRYSVFVLILECLTYYSENGDKMRCFTSNVLSGNSKLRKKLMQVYTILDLSLDKPKQNFLACQEAQEYR